MSKVKSSREVSGRNSEILQGGRFEDLWPGVSRKFLMDNRALCAVLNFPEPFSPLDEHPGHAVRGAPAPSGDGQAQP